MKVQHASYANQKLNTQWGDFVCDAEGVVEINGDAIPFFTGPLKFIAVDVQAKAAAKKAAPEETKKEAAPAPEAPVEVAEEEVVAEPEVETEEEPVAKSRFVKGGKKGKQ